MAAVSPAQLGIIPAVLRSLCCVAAAHSAVAAVDFSLVMLCDVAGVPAVASAEEDEPVAVEEP